MPLINGRWNVNDALYVLEYTSHDSQQQRNNSDETTIQDSKHLEYAYAVFTCWINYNIYYD